jgi:hypothetical protein
VTDKFPNRTGEDQAIARREQFRRILQAQAGIVEDIVLNAPTRAQDIDLARILQEFSGPVLVAAIEYRVWLREDMVKRLQERAPDQAGDLPNCS